MRRPYRPTLFGQRLTSLALAHRTVADRRCDRWRERPLCPATVRDRLVVKHARRSTMPSPQPRELSPGPAGAELPLLHRPRGAAPGQLPLLHRDRGAARLRGRAGGSDHDGTAPATNITKEAKGERQRRYRGEKGSVTRETEVKRKGEGGERGQTGRQAGASGRRACGGGTISARLPVRGAVLCRFPYGEPGSRSRRLPL